MNYSISVFLYESQHLVHHHICRTTFIWPYFNISSPNSSDQNNDGSADNGEHRPQSDNVPPTNQSTEEANQVFKKEEKVEEQEKEKEQNLTSTPDKVPSTLAPLQLSQLRTKNTDSFDIEEVRPC